MTNKMQSNKTLQKMEGERWCGDVIISRPEWNALDDIIEHFGKSPNLVKFKKGSMEMGKGITYDLLICCKANGGDYPILLTIQEYNDPRLLEKLGGENVGNLLNGETVMTVSRWAKRGEQSSTYWVVQLLLKSYLGPDWFKIMDNVFGDPYSRHDAWSVKLSWEDNELYAIGYGQKALLPRAK